MKFILVLIAFTGLCVFAVSAGIYGAGNSTNDIKTFIKQKAKESAQNKDEDVVIGTMYQVERDNNSGFKVFFVPPDYYLDKIEFIEPGSGAYHEKPFKSFNKNVRNEILGIFVKYANYKDVVCILVNSGKKMGYFVFARTYKNFTLREYYFK